MMGVINTVEKASTPVAPKRLRAMMAATGMPIMMTAMFTVSPTTTDHMPPMEA